MINTEKKRIELDLLDPSKTNPRTKFDGDYIKGLAENFLAHCHPERDIHGIKQDLLVRPRPDGRFEIVTGECRFRGSKVAVELATAANQPELAAMMRSAPCRVEDLSDREVLAIQLVENLKRTDLSAVEEARGYKRLLDLPEQDGQPRYTVEMISKDVGKSMRTIYDKLKLLDAPESLLALLDDPESGIKEAYALAVARIPDPKLKDAAVQRLLEGKDEWDGEEWRRVPLGLAEFKRIIREEFMVSLKGAPWNLDDAELLPEAGPCAACPHLAKNIIELQDELATAREGGGVGGRKRGIDPLTCGNPACHAKKMQAHFVIASKAVKAGGGRVMTGKEVKEVFHERGSLRHDSNFVPLDAKPAQNITGVHDDSKVPTFRKMAEKAGAKPQITIAMSPAGEVVEMMDKNAALELAKGIQKTGALKPAKPKLTAQQIKAKEAESRKTRIAAKTKTMALELLFQKARHGIGVDQRKALLEQSLHQAGVDGCRLLAEWLGCKPARDNKSKLGIAEQLAECILKAVEARGIHRHDLEFIEILARVAKEVKQWQMLPTSWTMVAEAFGIKASDVTKAATKAVDDEIAAKKAAKKAKEPAPGKKQGPQEIVDVERQADVTAAADEANRLPRADAPKQRVGKKLLAQGRVTQAQIDEADSVVQLMQVAKPKGAAKKEGGAKPVPETDKELEGMARRIIKGASYAQVLGKMPAKNSPHRKEWDARRVKLYKAVKKLMGTK